MLFRSLVEDDDEDEDDDDESLTRSHFGGAPDLPPDMPWPSVEGEPLTFVVQLDLAALAEFEAASELPREGLLSFFYAPLPPDAPPDVVKRIAAAPQFSGSR